MRARTLVAAVMVAGLLIAAVTGLPASTPGYERSCARGAGCVFGPAWTDDADGVDWGHNGCDTRNDVLRRDLTEVQVKPGTHGCLVLSGTLVDPYSGAQVAFVRGAESAQVQVDHVFPLSQAWNRGAASWALSRRISFANDPLNLVATTAAENQAKSDKMPGQWSPSTAPGRCLYVLRFRQVAERYALVVTWPERVWLAVLSHGCPNT